MNELVGITVSGIVFITLLWIPYAIINAILFGSYEGQPTRGDRFIRDKNKVYRFRKKRRSINGKYRDIDECLD